MHWRLSVILAALLAFGLGGCALFGNKDDKSPVRLRETLEVPPDLARPAGDTLGAVPAGGSAAYSDYSGKTGATDTPSAASQPSAAAPSRVRLERDGAQRWLVVQDAPDRTWATARAYLLRNNYKLVVDSPQTGLLETDWIERPVRFSGVVSRIIASLSSTGLRDKFRVRVEAGRTPGTTEVYVSQLGLEEVVSGSSSGVGVTATTWQPRASDPELEADLLAKLMVDFGLDSQQARNQVASASTARAQLVKDALFLPQQDLDSAWRRVGQALDRSRVMIEDLDRSAGIYYVHYVQDGGQKKGGGLFGLFGGGSGDSGDSKPQDRFQVALTSQATGSSVSVRDVKGSVDSSAEAAGLLQILYQQLR